MATSRGIVIEGMRELDTYFETLAKEEKKAVKRALTISAGLVKNEVVSSIRNVSKGIIRDKKGRWQKATSKRGKKQHRVSHAGEPPNTDTGRLIQSIQTEVTDATASVGTNVEYGRYLELGTSKMAARPFLTPAVEKNRAKVEKIFQEQVFGVIK